MKAAVSSTAHLEAFVDQLIPFSRVSTSIVRSSPVTFRQSYPQAINLYSNDAMLLAVCFTIFVYHVWGSCGFRNLAIICPSDDVPKTRTV